MPYSSSRSYSINAPQFDRGVLRITWRQVAEPPELVASYEELLVCAIRSKNCRFWLLDISQRNCPELSFIQWLEHEYTVRAAQQLAGPIFAAYLVAPHQLSSLQPLRDAGGWYRHAEANYYFSFFENAALALDWLRDQQELEPVRYSLAD